MSCQVGDVHNKCRVKMQLLHEAVNKCNLQRPRTEGNRLGASQQT